MELEENDSLKLIYRRYLSEELSRPEIQSHKKKLLDFFYVPAAPVFSLFHAPFLVPAIMLLGIFVLFYQIQSATQLSKGPALPIYQDFAEAKPLPDPVKNHMKPRVVVKRVSSRMGPTLVYQRSYREVPVTIVWVFAPGGGSK